MIIVFIIENEDYSELLSLNKIMVRITVFKITLSLLLPESDSAAIFSIGAGVHNCVRFIFF